VNFASICGVYWRAAFNRVNIVLCETPSGHPIDKVSPWYGPANHGTRKNKKLYQREGKEGHLWNAEQPEISKLIAY